MALIQQKPSVARTRIRRLPSAIDCFKIQGACIDVEFKAAEITENRKSREKMKGVKVALSAEEKYRLDHDGFPPGDARLLLSSRPGAATISKGIVAAGNAAISQPRVAPLACAR